MLSFVGGHLHEENCQHKCKQAEPRRDWGRPNLSLKQTVKKLGKSGPAFLKFMLEECCNRWDITGRICGAEV
jgi:hypothetical protein